MFEEIKNCLFCNDKCKTAKAVYCSNKCQAAFQRNVFIKTIEENKGFPSNQSVKSPATIRKYLLYTRPHKCEICNNTEWMNQKIPLIADHIDGNSENSLLSNLRLVCGNCDMQLPTYKSKNKGNGRAYRRQRYAEGKSY